MKVENVSVYGLAESIYRSGYAMMGSPPTRQEFCENVSTIESYLRHDDINNPHIKRAINLANAEGGGHSQFLTGIIVQFDLTFSNKVWVEAERYAFLNFITSMSTMHRISKFKIRDMCNKYTTKESIEIAEKLQDTYLGLPPSKEKEDAYLVLLNNLPSGLEITAGMTTNYRCLNNVYEQRHKHKLPEWREFCKWIETLPMAEELIIPKPQQTT